MDSFYALIYVKPNALTDEHLTVGLFTAGAEGPRLYLSEKRLKLLNDVVHRNTFLSLRRHLKSFQQQVDKYRNNNKDLLLFDPTYSEQRLKELSSATKKTLRYSTPTSVNAWMDQNCHLGLMQQLLGEKPQIVKKAKKSFYHKWKALCNANRYLEFKRHILSSEVKKKTKFTLRLDLYSNEKKRIFKGLDFDTSPKNVSERLVELVELCDEFAGFNVTCVYPKPKKKVGRATLEEVKSKLSLKLEFMDINTFEKQSF